MSHALCDALQAHLKLKSDAKVAFRVGLDIAVLSRARHGKYHVTAGAILRIYDATGWSIEHIRALIADPAPRIEKPVTKRVRKQPVTLPLLKALLEKPSRPRTSGLTESPLAKRLTVTKTPKWVSTVHRMM